MLQEPKRPNLERRIGEAIVHCQHIFTSSSAALFRRGYTCLYMCVGETRGGGGGGGVKRESGGGEIKERERERVGQGIRA